MSSWVDMVGGREREKGARLERFVRGLGRRRRSSQARGGRALLGAVLAKLGCSGIGTERQASLDRKPLFSLEKRSGKKTPPGKKALGLRSLRGLTHLPICQRDLRLAPPIPAMPPPAATSWRPLPPDPSEKSYRPPLQPQYPERSRELYQPYYPATLGPRQGEEGGGSSGERQGARMPQQAAYYYPPEVSGVVRAAGGRKDAYRLDQSGRERR